MMYPRLDITIDTREQAPWHFPREVARTRIGTLPTGDYALTGDGGFAIERKSLDDFVGTVCTQWDRFERELERMADWPARVVIVEAGFSELVFQEREGALIPPAHQHPLCSPPYILKRIGQMVYAGCGVLFAESAEYAAMLAVAVLRERAKEIGL